MANKIEVLGGVVVKGQEYINQDIIKLLAVPFKRWDTAGDLSKEEGDIYIKIGRSQRIFHGKDYLPQALAYIKEVLVNA